MHTLDCGKSSQKCGLLLQFSKTMPKVNNRPLGENSPNLVTLLSSRVEKRTRLNFYDLKNDGSRNVNKGLFFFPSREFAKEKERVESRAGFMQLKEQQKLEKELNG
jgi:hypothetical protein